MIRRSAESLRPSITGVLAAIVIATLAASAAQAQPFIGTFGNAYAPFAGKVALANKTSINPLQWKELTSVNIGPAVDKAWAAARGPVSKKISDEMGKGGRWKGQTAYQITINLASKGQLLAKSDVPSSASLKYVLSGNSAVFKMTTPTVFGSYGDPKFHVDFDAEVTITLTVKNLTAAVAAVDVNILNAKIRGANVTGTVGLAVVDLINFLGGPDLRGQVVNAINGQKAAMTQPLDAELAKLTARIAATPVVKQTAAKANANAKKYDKIIPIDKEKAIGDLLKIVPKELEKRTMQFWFDKPGNRLIVEIVELGPPPVVR